MVIVVVMVVVIMVVVIVVVIMVVVIMVVVIVVVIMVVVMVKVICGCYRVILPNCSHKGFGFFLFLPSLSIESTNALSSGLKSATFFTSLLFATTKRGLLANKGLIDLNKETCSDVNKERGRRS